MPRSDPAPEETFTSRPCGLTRSRSAKAIASRHGPSVFVSSASRTTSRSAPSTRTPGSQWIAALFTSTSSASSSERDRTAIVELRAGRSGTRIAEALTRTVRHMLRLDEDLSAFYEICRDDPQLSWCVNGAGRMLRAPTVFEDVVKTICTTNTAWAGTRRMAAALVEHLGQEAPGGGHAFPTPEAMAGAGEDFYRDVARAGYRGADLRQLATDVVEGRTDLEALADPELPDTEVAERLLALPGVGPYAAAHVMLTSLGHHGRLVLDAWSRPTYAKLSGARRALKDATIERRFKRYGRWAGLAFWLYVTRDWVEDEIAQEAS